MVRPQNVQRPTIARRGALGFEMGVAFSLLVAGGCQPSHTKPSKPPASAQAESEQPVSAVEVAPPTEDHPPLAAPDTPREYPGPSPVTERDQALHAVAHGNPGGAAEFLSTWLTTHPDDDDALLALVWAHRSLGQLEAASAVIEDIPPPRRTATHAREAALLLEAQGQAPAAIAALQVAHTRFPDDLPVVGELVRLLHETGQDDDPQRQALLDQLYDAYDAGRATQAADLLAVARGALTRGSKGAFKDANMVLEEAELLAPAEKGSLIGDRIRLVRARMFAEKYAAPDALATLELLLQRDSWHPDALAIAAEVQGSTLQFAEASRLANEALAVNPSHPVAHAVLAKVAVVEGRRQEAKQRIERHVLGTSVQTSSGPAIMAAAALMDVDPQAYRHWRDSALSHNPHNGTYYAELADLLGFLHLYPEAEEALREGIDKAPSDPYVRAARGLNLLRLGEEAVARSELEQAWRRDPFNERTRNVLELYERSIDKNYEEFAVDGLHFRLPRADMEFVRDGLVETVQASKAALDEAYDIDTGPLRLEFFAEVHDFSIRTVGVPSLGAVAVCFGPVITFIGPYRGTHNIENVVRHELAHVYAIRKSRGRVPRWFTEGLSEWESELADPAWARESAKLLDGARRANKIRKLGELELAFIRAESPAMMEVAYSTAAYAVRYLGTTYGREPLVRMLEGYGKGKTTAQLTKEVLGREFSAIEREFEQWFDAQLDRQVRGWAPSPKGKTSDPLDKRFRQATEQIAKKQDEAAIKSLRALIDDGADGFTTRMWLARLLAQGSDPAAAQAHLEAAHAWRPESLDPLVALANLAREQDDATREKGYLVRALAIDGEAFEPAARLLLLAEATGDPASTALALRRARAIAPLHPLTLAAVALSYARNDQTAQAQTFFGRASQGLPEPGRGPSDTWAMVALVAQRLGHDDLAHKAATVALERDDLPSIVTSRLRKL